MVVGGHVGSFISTREQENPVDDDSVDAHAPLEIEDDVKCQSLDTCRHMHKLWHLHTLRIVGIPLPANADCHSYGTWA